MSEMTSLQRVQATVDRDIPDRVPVVLFFQSAAQHAAVRDDVSWQELLNSPAKLYRNIRQQFEFYGADNFFLPLDFRLTGEAFGSRCEYTMKSGGGMRMPVVTEFALQGIEGIEGGAIDGLHRLAPSLLILHHAIHPNISDRHGAVHDVHT